MTTDMKPIAWHLEASGMTVRQLVAACGLDRKLVEAIVRGNYIPSPKERQILAKAIGIATDEISWDHAVPVEHMRGNGPQFGRST